MAVNTDNVRIGITGACYVGVTTATAPTDATTALTTGATGFADLGAINEDGITETRDRSTDSITIWQNAAKAREVVTDSSFTIGFTMVETKKETVELFYGTTVNTTEGSVVVVPASTGGRKSFVIDVVDGSRIKRIYVPSGEITEVGDVVYQNGDPVGYEVTINAYYGTYLTNTAQFTGSAKVWYSDLKS